MSDQCAVNDGEIRSMNGTLVAVRYEVEEGASILVEIDRLTRAPDETFHNPIFVGSYDSMEAAKLEVSDFLNYSFGNEVPAPPQQGGCGREGCGGGSCGRR